MTFFIKKIISFSLIVATLFTMASGVNYFLLKKIFDPKNVTINANTLILGDSHAVTGIDPSLLPNSLNFSMHSEHLLYTYYKLKWLLKTKSNIKSVYLTIGHHSIMGDETIEKEKWQEILLPKYMPVIDSTLNKVFPQLNKTIIKNNLIYKYGILNNSSINYSVKSILNDVRYTNYRFLGSYMAKSGINIIQQSLDSTLNRHYKNRHPNIHSRATEYLQKIITLCSSNNIELTLVVTPLYNGYYSRIPLEVKKSFDSLLLNLQKENVPVLNFSTLQLPDENFGDGDHLNEKGAKNFTAKLNELVNKK